tara:strand:- start:1710 stop:2798 length:1089 start_codon:yes stop_codon:yes gene_type:complete
MSLIFRKRKVDVIFYYPHHFNRGDNGENLYFVNMINSCKKNNISYLVFEEPDYTSTIKRNSNNISFDFIFLIIILLRKLYRKDERDIIKDHKIGSILNSLFFRMLYFNNVITISQSMVSFFRGVNSKCKIFDIQHGIIYQNKVNYILNNKVASNLLENNVNLLLSGQSYKDILLKNDMSFYFKSHTTVIGSNIIVRNKPMHSKFNENILVTLQFTHDHDDYENKVLFSKLKDFIESSDKMINFYLKQHPRFNNEINISEILKFNNVHVAPEDLNECLQLCSLHATAYSTTTFEAALYGIPTILINPLKKFNCFSFDFKYPLDYSINDFENESLYQASSKILINWSRNYYSSYNEKYFLNLLK